MSQNKNTSGLDSQGLFQSTRFRREKKVLEIK